MKMTIGDVFTTIQKIKSTISCLEDLMGNTDDNNDADAIDNAINLLGDYRDMIMSVKIDL